MRTTTTTIVDTCVDDDETFCVIVIRNDRYEQSLPTYVMIDGVRYAADSALYGADHDSTVG